MIFVMYFLYEDIIYIGIFIYTYNMNVNPCYYSVIRSTGFWRKKNNKRKKEFLTFTGTFCGEDRYICPTR